MAEVVTARADARAAIVEAAARMLREDGPGAVTTRRVAERAGIQAPTIYRLFGDKDGLLEAVAEHVMAMFVTDKAEGVAAATAEQVDPLDDLRASWRKQIEFGLANPALFRLLSDPERVLNSAAARRGRQVLATRIHRLALAGRLRVSEPHAADLIHAAGTGTIQTLLSTPRERRDPYLGEAMRDAVLNRIVTGAPPELSDGPVATAVAMRALTPELRMLSEPERQLLVEWLDRISQAPEAAKKEQDTDSSIS